VIADVAAPMTSLTMTSVHYWLHCLQHPAGYLHHLTHHSQNQATSTKENKEWSNS
jgi:hypothetical protein